MRAETSTFYSAGSFFCCGSLGGGAFIALACVDWCGPWLLPTLGAGGGYGGRVIQRARPVAGCAAVNVDKYHGKTFAGVFMNDS